MRHWLWRMLSTVALVALLATVAQACPMCNQSIAEENHLPRAFMYSILFMLGMPATLFGGFGLTLYLKYRQYDAQQAAAVEQLGSVEGFAPVALPTHG
ncbi:MAG: hypothetical protein ACT4QC_08640 [Planctomycetaceae bacterium]